MRGENKGFLGLFVGFKKPGFYRCLGLFASIWEKNPVSGWAAGANSDTAARLATDFVADLMDELLVDCGDSAMGNCVYTNDVHLRG